MLSASILARQRDMSVESFDPTNEPVHLITIVWDFTELSILQRVVPPDQIVHCYPETEEEAPYMIDLVHAERSIFKATKRLADARSLESKLHAEFYAFQSNEAAALIQKADLDIGVMTLAAMKWGLYRYPSPGAILHSQKYCHHCKLLS